MALPMFLLRISSAPRFFETSLSRLLIVEPRAVQLILKQRRTFLILSHVPDLPCPRGVRSSATDKEGPYGIFYSTATARVAVHHAFTLLRSGRRLAVRFDPDRGSDPRSRNRRRRQLRLRSK